MKKLIEKIKQYKWAFLGLVIIIFMFILAIMLGKNPSEETGLAPVIKETGEEPTPPVSHGVFFLESEYPPSEKTTISSKFTQVIFNFSKPINKSDVKVEVKPYILLTKSFSEDGKTLYVYPTLDPWLNKQEYTITVSNIESIDGEKLTEGVIKHTYYNEEPPTDEGAGGEVTSGKYRGL